MTMPHGRAAITAGLALAALGLLVACAPSAQQLSEDRIQVLQSYLEAERAVMADFLAQTTTYSDAEVNGYFEGNSGGEDFPAAVITFTYTYSERVVFREPLDESRYPSWESIGQTYSLADLESKKLSLISACTSQVVPAMRDAGLVGDLRIEYIYLNRQFTNDESWRAFCSSAAR